MKVLVNYKRMDINYPEAERITCCDWEIEGNKVIFYSMESISDLLPGSAKMIKTIINFECVTGIFVIEI
jgi:hypothetical protein